MYGRLMTPSRAEMTCDILCEMYALFEGLDEYDSD